MGIERCSFHGTACCFFLSQLHLFSVSADRRTPRSPIPQFARPSFLPSFSSWSSRCLRCSSAFGRPGVQPVRRNISQREARSHRARMAWRLRAIICRPVPFLGYPGRSIHPAWTECSLPQAIWLVGLLSCFLSQSRSVASGSIHSPPPHPPPSDTPPPPSSPPL